jgi:hypothetical protein
MNVNDLLMFLNEINVLVMNIKALYKHQYNYKSYKYKEFLNNNLLIIDKYVQIIEQLELMYQLNESIQKMFHCVMKKGIDNNTNMVD